MRSLAEKLAQPVGDINREERRYDVLAQTRELGRLDLPTPGIFLVALVVVAVAMQRKPGANRTKSSKAQIPRAVVGDVSSNSGA